MAALFGETLEPPAEALVDNSGTTKEHSRGVTSPESALPLKLAVQIDDSARAEHVQQVLPEPQGSYRLSAVAGGKQPSYGKRAQLIQDGLRDAHAHLELAKKLDHPFDSLANLKNDRVRVVNLFSKDNSKILIHRIRQLKDLEDMVKSLASEQARENRSASWTARKLGLKIQTVAMRKLQKQLSIEDGPGGP